MNRKEVREWLKGREDFKGAVDELRKEFEVMDIPTLLGLVELSEVAQEKIKFVLIAEILRSRSVVASLGGRK